MDEDLGLSEREKELKKWNRPYRYQEFPKMLFRGTTTTGGRLEVEQRVVKSELEQSAAEEAGWLPHPTRAIDAETTRQEAPGLAAAERAYRDRVMSEVALREAAQADEGTARHLGAIPETPRRPRPPRSHKKKPAPEPTP